MAMLTIDYWSPVLDKWTAIKVFINDHAEPPYPTLYLLHGLAGNHTHWTRYTLVERLAREYPFLVVMPDGGRSFYCDSPLGAYETFLVKDLVPYIDRILPTRKQRRYRATGGLSMGGYGAIKLGLKYPQLFGAIMAHSSSVQFAHVGIDEYKHIPETEVFAHHLDREANDVYALARQCPAKQRPHLYFDCGRDDMLFAENDKFHRHLSRCKFPHTFRRFDGGHTWEYWNTHVRDSFDYLLEVMRLPRVPV